MKTSTSKIIRTFSAAAFIFASVSSVSAESCYLAKQLENPEARALYEQKINEANEAQRSVYGNGKTYSTEYLFANGESQTVDSFSSDCMTCHDGVSAKYHEIRIRNGQRAEAISMNTVLGSHPIGMHYGTAVYENRSLRDQESLNPNMTMVDGRVGCLSCHNLLNPEQYHLAVDNSQSQLCLNCHIR